MMDGLLDWGADVIRSLEAWRPEFDTFFRLVTQLGDMPFLFALLGAVYWLLDRDLAIRVMLMLAVSTFVNVWLKQAFAEPRPADHDPSLTPLVDLASYGFPSGHAETAVILAGSFALAYPQRWVRWVAAAGLVLIPFSRLYLGVHFPHDLVGGFVVGALILWAGVRYGPLLVDGFFSRPLWGQLLLAGALPIVGTMLVANPGSERGGAVFAGAFLGLVVERRWINLGVVTGRRVALWRAIVGFGGVALLWWPAIETVDIPVGPLGLFAMALWVTAGAPWAFQRLEQGPTFGPDTSRPV